MPREPLRATRLRCLGGLGRGAGDHLGAPRCVRGENSPIDHPVRPRRGNEGDEALDELGRREDEGRGAVTPDALEADLDAAVLAALETVLRERGAEDVPAQPLEAGAVGRLEAHAGVQAGPGEARAPGRKRELLPPEHLHAPRPLPRPLADGRLPEERGDAGGVGA